MYEPPQFSYEPPPGQVAGSPRQSAPSNSDSLSNLEVRIDGVDLGVRRLRRRPGVFVVPRAKVVRIVEGDVSFAAEDLLTFNTQSEVVVLLRHTRGRLIVAMLDGWIRVWKTRSPNALSGVDFDLPTPTVHAWLEGLECAPWLASLATQLATSEHVLEQAAAVGVLGRLWEPPDGNYAPLNNKLRAWARELDATTLATLSDAALEQALDMTQGLEDFSSMDRARAEDTARWMVDWREMLESVAWLLGIRGSASDLDTALRTLDRTTSIHWSRLDDLPDPGQVLHPHHWRAVGWQEPQAWWGGSDV